MIKDSGERREFDTGAVRDIQEGKGRCDLLPLDVVGQCYRRAFDDDVTGDIFACLNLFTETGDIDCLYSVLSTAAPFDGWGEMFLEVSKHFEEGHKKYPPNADGVANWKLGIPAHSYIDSAVRHYLKWLRGDDDERHDRAFCWNILCCIWTCVHKPELNDYRKDEET